MQVIETFKDEMNQSLKDIQENINKKVEALKKEMDDYKEIKESTIKKLKKGTTVHNLKMDIEA